ncbi:amidohydrolase family protein [Candidatus Bipolaricaulota bacterium]
MSQLIENIAIWNGRDVVMSEGSILIEEGMVTGVFTPQESPDTPQNVERIDGAGKLAIPGLINAHTHLYSSLARGMAVTPYAPTTFTEILEQLWWKLDKALDDETVKTSALVGAMEAARCGVTTLVDHHASPNAIDGSLDRLREAVCDDVGLRGVFCYELTDRDGPKRSAQGIDENMRFLRAVDSLDVLRTMRGPVWVPRVVHRRRRSDRTCRG